MATNCTGHSNFVAIDMRQNLQNTPPPLPLFHPSHLLYLQALLHQGDVTTAHQDANHRIELREVSVGGAQGRARTLVQGNCNEQ